MVVSKKVGHALLPITWSDNAEADSSPIKHKKG